jgi:pimeloyl-ACP methyl ester carboxylesterase
MARLLTFCVNYSQGDPMRIPFMTFMLAAITIAAHAQQSAKLPFQSDWFLPIGEWNKSPELYVKEYGSGQDTVIMLHGGWGADHEGLVDAVKGLSKQYHFVFYDQRGSLRSPFPDSLISYSAHIEDLELLRKTLRLKKITLVGHSMGGMLAAAYASKYPDRIKTLVLLAPANLKSQFSNEEKEISKKQIAGFDKFFGRTEVATELNKYKLLRPENELSVAELNARAKIDFARRMLYDVTKWSKMTGGRGLFKGNVYAITERSYPKEGWDLIASLEEQSFPVRIITGDHDFIDFENVLIKKWTAGKKQFTFTPVPRAGHLLWIDQPEIFTKELGNALK